MRTLFPVSVEAQLLLAPPAVQRTYERTNTFLNFACGALGLRPSPQALADCFWTTFRQEGGTITDFEWILAADLCDENDRKEVTQ